eukprot:1637269-Amphidinium_carterae.1
MNELRPGGRIMITQPRRALAKTMASHLKGINKEHQYLFGFHYSGHASSSSHDEPILYMTEGITVAILMTWVSRVMTLVKKQQAWSGPEAESNKGGTAGLRAAVPSSGESNRGGTAGLRAAVPSSGGSEGGGTASLRAVPSSGGTQPKEDNPWNPEFQ